MKKGTSVGSATSYWLEDRGYIPSRGKDFSPQHPYWFWTSPSILLNNYPLLFFTWGKATGAWCLNI
jgi:hypothetical protein